MSGTTSGLTLSVPQPSIPFLNEDGKTISRPWLYFLIGLMNRTGGTTTPVTFADIQKEIASLFVETAMVDDNTSDFASIQQQVISLSVENAMNSDAMPASVNPFLAALLVS